MNKALIILSLAAGAQLLSGQDCLAIRGLGQARLPASVHLNENDSWGGTIYLSLDGKEMLVGVFSGQDGTVAWHGPNGLNGNGKGGSMTFAFTPQGDATYRDTITTYVVNGSFPEPPGSLCFGTYHASHKIIAGTGRFANATGTIQISGTFVWFPLSGGTEEVGYFNPDFSGFICNVAPAP